MTITEINEINPFWKKLAEPGEPIPQRWENLFRETILNRFGDDGAYWLLAPENLHCGHIEA